MEEKYTIKEFITNAFIETPETKYIKDYTKYLKTMDDFKDIGVCFVQFRDSEVYKSKLKLYNITTDLTKKIISTASSIKTSNGFTTPKSNSIIILLDNLIRFGKIKYIKINITPKISNLIQIEKENNWVKKTCSNILKTMYHEKKHIMQQNNISNDFDSIMYQIETNERFTLLGIKEYKLHHDKWYFEIDANNYGVNKAIDYYKNNPSDNNVDINNLEHLKKVYYYDKLTYDFDYFFTSYNNHKKVVNPINTIREKIASKLVNSKDLAWHKLLYDENNKIRDIEQIINSPLVNEVDPKFVNLVLTSRYLNDNLNYQSQNISVLKRLKAEFELRYKEISKVIEELLQIDDKYILQRNKKNIERIKNDFSYYKEKITLLDEIINKEQNSIHKK